MGSFIVFFIVNRSRVIFSIRKNPLNIPLFVFFLGFCVSAIFAERPLESVFALIQLLFCIYILTTVIYLCDTKKILQMIVITTVIHVIILILYLAEIVDVGLITRKWHLRPSFGNVEPNIAARVYFIGLIIIIYLLRNKIWFFLKIGALFSILITVSRTGLLALFMIFTSKWKFGKVLFAAILFIIIVGLFVNVPDSIDIDIVRHYTTRVSKLVHMTGLSAQERFYMYTEGPILFFEKFFLVGTGMDNPSPVSHAHNVMISVAIGNGVFGLIGYILMYILILLIAWSLERRFGLLMVLVLGTMIFDLFMPVSENRIYWFPFSLTLGVYLKRLYISKNNRYKNPANVSVKD